MSKSKERTDIDRVLSTERYKAVQNFAHLQPRPLFNLYYMVRMHLQITQKEAARRTGIALTAWCYREKLKRLYHLVEIDMLRELSGLSDSDFIKLIRDIS